MISITKKDRVVIITLLAVACITLTFFIRPFAQDINFHSFADKREFGDIPNFFNVVSNTPFLVTGLLGVIFCIRKLNLKDVNSIMLNNLMFFSGILLTGVGSSYYHNNPNNNTLVWDRLPMAISFMSFFSIIIARFVSVRTGKRIVWHLLFIGVCSVFYWHLTELAGRGDLRFFMLVQFLPMVLIPIILFLYRKQTKDVPFFLLLVFIYALAKALEALDYPIFSSELISGHSLKHIMACIAPILYLNKLSKEHQMQHLNSHFKHP